MCSQGGTIEILHVDDEPEFADLTAGFLGRQGERLAVESVTTVEAGLAFLREDTV